MTTTSTSLRPASGRPAALLLTLLVAVGITACSPAPVRPAFTDLLTVFDMFDPFKVPQPR